MLIAFVVRLSPSALQSGVLAGEVEHVASGDRGRFRDAEELAAWCALQPAAPEVRSAPGNLHVVSSADDAPLPRGVADAAQRTGEAAPPARCRSSHPTTATALGPSTGEANWSFAMS